MQNLIDASNVGWRRQITTINNQLANENERINTQNLLGISEARQNQLWQQYRDEAVWANQSFENEQSRNQALALSALAFNRSIDLADMQQDDQFGQAIGAFASRFVNNAVFGIPK